MECTIDGCAGPIKSGGIYCEKHRARFRRHGDPNIVLKDHTPAAERWKTSYEVDPETGCWNWTKRGHNRKGGYGLISNGQNQTTIKAHKFVYEQIVGNVPDGFELDHLCNNMRCVNPDHLEPVTQSENALRAVQRRQAQPQPETAYKKQFREYMRERRAKFRETPHCCSYCGGYVAGTFYKLCEDCRSKKQEQYQRAKARRQK